MLIMKKYIFFDENFNYTTRYESEIAITKGFDNDGTLVFEREEKRNSERLLDAELVMITPDGRRLRSPKEISEFLEEERKEKFNILKKLFKKGQKPPDTKLTQIDPSILKYKCYNWYNREKSRNKGIRCNEIGRAHV